MIKAAAMVIVLMACACSEYQDGDMFFVRNRGADMPVLVRGDGAADTIILMLHGGPGGSSIIGLLVPAYLDLEDDHLVAYWDQRGSGVAQGDAPPSSFTVEVFVEDTGLVVEVLRKRYPGKRIVLMGHSWGGALAVAYAGRDQNQDRIDAVVIVDSGHNLVKGLPLSVDWIEAEATARIDEGRKIGYWTKVRDWCAAEPDMTVVSNYRQYVKYLEATDSLHYDEAETDKVAPNGAYIFASPASLALGPNAANIQKRFNILELDLTEELRHMTIPTLVLWGEHDSRNVIEMADDAYENLGTVAAEKRLVTFERSGHEPFLEEREAFLDAVRQFLEGY